MLLKTLNILCLAIVFPEPAMAQAQGEPTLEEFRALFEPAIRNQLVDPESARFEWPYHFSRETNGFLTCGYVNSRNRMGGYGGRTAVVAVFNRGAVPYFNILEDEAPTCPRYVTDKLSTRSPQAVDPSNP